MKNNHQTKTSAFISVHQRLYLFFCIYAERFFGSEAFRAVCRCSRFYGLRSSLLSSILLATLIGVGGGAPTLTARTYSPPTDRFIDLLRNRASDAPFHSYVTITNGTHRIEGNMVVHYTIPEVIRIYSGAFEKADLQYAAHPNAIGEHMGAFTGRMNGKQKQLVLMWHPKERKTHVKFFSDQDTPPFKTEYPSVLPNFQEFQHHFQQFGAELELHREYHHGPHHQVVLEYRFPQRREQHARQMIRSYLQRNGWSTDPVTAATGENHKGLEHYSKNNWRASLMASEKNRNTTLSLILNEKTAARR